MPSAARRRPAAAAPALAALARFARAERASVSIEALIILPVLVLFYLVSFTFYDAYRTQTVVTKAGYTVADLISRESGTVTTNDVVGMGTLFEYITRGRPESAVRLTAIRRRVEREPDNPTPTVDVYEVIDSWGTDGLPPMTNQDLTDRLANVPNLSENEHVTVIETFAPYRPPFFVGLDPFVMESFMVTRQRTGLPIDFDPTPPTNVALTSSSG